MLIHSKDDIQFIYQKDILYCQSDNCYTNIFLLTGEILLISKSLTKFSKEVLPGKFIRVNQSYLVNVDYIKSVDKRKKQIELINLFKIPFTITIKQLLFAIDQLPHTNSSL